jgi:CxxC motif-containing protein
MKEELTCITCPLGCRLVAERPSTGASDNVGDAVLTVTGNRCPRGAVYAREELLAPKRVVTATCRAVRANETATSGARAAFSAPRRIPCKTSAPFPKDRVPELLAVIYALEVRLPVALGQVLLGDALGSGIDLVATRSIAL